MERPRVGHIVSSLAGRDAGKRYVVVGSTGDRFVDLADGVVRPFDNPKRKNVKHVRLEGSVGEDLERALTNKATLRNSDIRRALEELDQSKHGGDD